MATTDIGDPSSVIRKQAKRQKKNAKIIRFLVIFLIVVSFLILPSWSLYLLIGGIGPGLFEETPTYIYLVIALLMYSIFFIVPFLLCLPVIMPFALQQKNVGRIIVLRKFNDDASKRALGNIIKNHLSNYGHVFTLSDKNFKVKWFIKIPVFLGQLSLFHFRQRTISKEEDIAELEKKLSGKIWLNVNWLLSSNKIFSIKTTDALWKETAVTLLRENRVIVFDISYETDSLEWEFMEIKNLGYAENIIAITNSEKLLAESKWKNIFDSQKKLGIPVFYYDKKGKIPQQTEFDDAIVHILAGSFKEEDLSTSKTNFFKRTAATTGIVLLLFLVSLIFLSPYLLPDVVGKNSPFAKQVITAYIQSKIQSPFNDSANQRVIYNRVKTHWQKQAAAVLIKYAGSHYNAECDAVQSTVVEFTDPSYLNEYIHLALTAEPPVADSALSILLKINSPKLDKIALQCIGNARIDVKQRALKILERVTLDSTLVTGIIQTIGKTTEPAKQKPKQHRGGSFFNTSNLGVDLIVTESNFYIDLYNLLKHNKYITSKLLHSLLNNPSEQPRIFASLLSADYNNASGITTLIRASFLKGKDRRYLIQFKPDTAYPYREKVDSLLLDLNNAVAVPSIDSLKLLLNTYTFNKRDSVTLVNLLIFVIENYTARDFNSFIQNFADNNLLQLREALIYSILNNVPQVNKNLQSMIAFSKPLLIKNVNNQNIESKLKIAKLLAYTGDVSVMPILKEAAAITKPFLGLQTYSYSNNVLDILEILYKNIQPPYNAQPFISMKNDYFFYDDVLNKLIAKASKKLH